MALEFGVQKAKSPKYIALQAIAGLLFVLAGIFALIALHHYLSLSFDPVQVNGLFAGGFALLAIFIILMVVGLKRRRQAASAVAPLKRQVRDAMENGVRVVENVKDYTHSHTGTLLLAAAVVGIFMGSRARGKRRKNSDTA